jgi:hypothetical protein
MNPKDLIKQFPDATTNRNKPKPVVDTRPNDVRTTIFVFAAAMIGLPIALLLIGLLAYLGQKYNW